MLVLEDPGGEPLDRLLERQLDLTRFLRIAIGLSRALGKLHEHGIIHKDIKPANVMVDPTSDQVWLTGFGIASDLRASAKLPSLPKLLRAPSRTWRPNRPAV